MTVSDQQIWKLLKYTKITIHNMTFTSLFPPSQAWTSQSLFHSHHFYVDVYFFMNDSTIDIYFKWCIVVALQKPPCLGPEFVNLSVRYFKSSLYFMSAVLSTVLTVSSLPVRHSCLRLTHIPHNPQGSCCSYWEHTHTTAANILHATVFNISIQWAPKITQRKDTHIKTAVLDLDCFQIKAFTSV